MGTFGPTIQDYNRVLAAIRAAGFRVTSTSRNRSIIELLGSADVVNAFFKTQMHLARQDRFGLRYFNSVAETIPAAISDVTLAVVGLSNVQVLHTDNTGLLAPRGLRNVPPSGTGIQTALGGVAALTGPTFGPNGYGLGPAAIALSYNMPVQQGIVGQNIGTGVVIDADFLNSDLNAYLAYFKITRTRGITRFEVDGGAQFNGNPNSDSVEASLDVETIAGLASGSPIFVYLIPSLANNYVIDAYNRAVEDNASQMTNSSFGGCEDQLGQSFDFAVSSIADQGDVKGLGFAASSGDNGYFGCPGGTHHIQAPADGAFFTAVGGTSAATATRAQTYYANQSAWSGSGGGTSVYFVRQFYEQNVDPSAYRAIPDISFAADPDYADSGKYGASILFNGAWATTGGTSWASPIFTAYQAQLTQFNGYRRGFADPALYNYYRAVGYKGCIEDITTGSNGTPAIPGYDEATGLGSMHGSCPSL